MASEKELQTQVADFLRLQYPDVLFHSDYAGVNLSKAQAVAMKWVNGGRRAWPDMFIARVAEAKIINGRNEWNSITRDWDCYFGLFLELKKDGTRLKKKNGEWASEHIAEQAEVLEKLHNEGYSAEFAVGFDEAVKIIKDYLGDPRPRKVEF